MKGCCGTYTDTINAAVTAQIAFKQAAQHILDLSEEHLVELIHNGQFSEVEDDG